MFNAEDMGLKPDQLGGLRFWQDGDDFRTLSITGTGLTSHREKSGNGYTATPSGLLIPQSAAERINGRNAPIYNGTSGYCPLASGLYNIHNSATGTFIMVVKCDGPNASDRAILGGQSNGSTVVLSMQQRTTGPGVRFRASNVASNNANTTFAVGTNVRTWVLRKDAGTVRSYIDNNILATAAASSVTLTVLDLGRFLAFPTQLHKGAICESFFYSDTKSIADINRLRAEYVAPKWGASATPI